MDSTPRILAISPDAGLLARLSAGLARAGFLSGVETVGDYPAGAAVRALAEAEQPPAAVLVDYSQERPALRCLSEFLEALPQVLVVMVNGSRRLSSVVRAKQGGAWGYLADEADLGSLAEHFGLRPAPEPVASGRLVAFLPAQGGSGASTVCLHAAQRVSEGLPGETLLLDLDLHTGTVAFQLGLEPRRTLLDALAHPTPEGIRQCSSRWAEMDVLVGPADPEVIVGGPLARLDTLLESARRAYRFVVVDLPAAVYTSTLGVLRAADRIYFVCSPEITSLHLCKRKIERIGRAGIGREKVRLLLNRSGSRGGINAEHIERIAGVPVDWALDNDYAAVTEAAMRGGLVPRRTALAQQMAQLGAQLLEDFPTEAAGASAEDTPVAALRH